jgi:hypothetical protein
MNIKTEGDRTLPMFLMKRFNSSYNIPTQSTEGSENPQVSNASNSFRIRFWAMSVPTMRPYPAEQLFSPHGKATVFGKEITFPM